MNCNHNTLGARFFGFGKDIRTEDIRNRLQETKKLGIRKIVASYKTDGMTPVAMDEDYFQALDRLVEVCREEEIPFILEDYSPFPTGSANGAFSEPENENLNKIFLDERHMDICGPCTRAVIRIDELMQVNYGIAGHQFNKIEPKKRCMLGVVLVKLLENPESAACPFLQDDTAVVLTDRVENGSLELALPEGFWRIFVLYTTPESSGRPYYMNLLSKESVALEIERVHKPLYEHLKEEAGKLWLGFFYDEPEIGNDGGTDVFDYFMLPGRRSEDPCDVNVYPWSPEMPDELEKRDSDWIRKLPGIFYDGQEMTKDFRCTYMDTVSALVRDNYNGQVYQFCKEKGLLYIGHVLEDENCHTRLGCGPSHYFRQQYYQDEAGIDVIAGQILPGKDQTASWYGAINADGEFYHYGIAKLASSEAHINPLKKNRAFSEVFAMYGQQGLSERKFLLDHLLVNGITRFLYADLPSYQASTEYSSLLAAYAERLAEVVRRGESVIRTAVLYHAEAEWREGKNAEKFQRAAAVLAQNQISYDVIPADVFSDPEKYRTDISKGLRINGHSYEALIIPGCGKLPKSVEVFVREAEKNGFPVIFSGRMPEGIEAGKSRILCAARSKLADIVRSVTKEDFQICSEARKWLRTVGIIYQGKKYLLIHNEAGKGGFSAEISVPGEKTLLLWDVMTDTYEKPEQVISDGRTKAALTFSQWEMKVVLEEGLPAFASDGKDISKELTDLSLTLVCPDGFRTEGTLINPPRPEEHLGYGVYTKLVYKMKLVGRSFIDASGEISENRHRIILDLGTVSDAAEVFVNGQSTGKRPGAPYRFDLTDCFGSGDNEIRIEVFTSASNIRTPVEIFGMKLDSLTAVPHGEVLPMGISGPVSVKEKR